VAVQPQIDVDERGLTRITLHRTLKQMVRQRKKLSREELDAQIRAMQSLCKQKPGEKSVVQELIEERLAEKEKEDREIQPG
jgi:type I site-specific restriction-modification system R (restriction) subunit